MQPEIQKFQSGVSEEIKDFSKPTLFNIVKAFLVGFDPEAKDSSYKRYFEEKMTVNKRKRNFLPKHEEILGNLVKESPEFPAWLILLCCLPGSTVIFDQVSVINALYDFAGALVERSTGKGKEMACDEDYLSLRRTLTADHNKFIAKIKIHKFLKSYHAPSRIKWMLTLKSLLPEYHGLFFVKEEFKFVLDTMRTLQDVETNKYMSVESKNFITDRLERMRLATAKSWYDVRKERNPFIYIHNFDRNFPEFLKNFIDLNLLCSSPFPEDLEQQRETETANATECLVREMSDSEQRQQQEQEQDRSIAAAINSVSVDELECIVNNVKRNETSHSTPNPTPANFQVNSHANQSEVERLSEESSSESEDDDVDDDSENNESSPELEREDSVDNSNSPHRSERSSNVNVQDSRVGNSPSPTKKSSSSPPHPKAESSGSAQHREHRSEPNSPARSQRESSVSSRGSPSPVRNNSKGGVSKKSSPPAAAKPPPRRTPSPSESSGDEDKEFFTMYDKFRALCRNDGLSESNARSYEKKLNRDKFTKPKYSKFVDRMRNKIAIAMMSESDSENETEKKRVEEEKKLKQKEKKKREREFRQREREREQLEKQKKLKELEKQKEIESKIREAKEAKERAERDLRGIQQREREIELEHARSNDMSVSSSSEDETATTSTATKLNDNFSFNLPQVNNNLPAVNDPQTNMINLFGTFLQTMGGGFPGGAPAPHTRLMGPPSVPPPVSIEKLHKKKLKATEKKLDLKMKPFPTIPNKNGILTSAVQSNGLDRELELAACYERWEKSIMNGEVELSVLTPEELKYACMYRVPLIPTVEDEIVTSLENDEGNYFINNTMARIYNKLCEKSTSISESGVETPMHMYEMIVYMTFYNIKRMSQGSETQLKNRHVYNNNKKGPHEILQQELSKNTVCVICLPKGEKIRTDAHRVQYGWRDEAEKIILKFCSQCFKKQPEKCDAYLKTNPEMSRLGARMGDGRWQYVSFRGSQITVNETARINSRAAADLKSGECFKTPSPALPKMGALLFNPNLPTPAHNNSSMWTAPATPASASAPIDWNVPIPGTKKVSSSSDNSSEKKINVSSPSSEFKSPSSGSEKSKKRKMNSTPEFVPSSGEEDDIEMAERPDERPPGSGPRIKKTKRSISQTKTYDQLKNYKVCDLKFMCSNFKISTKGKKDELICRLLEHYRQRS